MPLTHTIEQISALRPIVDSYDKITIEIMVQAVRDGFNEKNLYYHRDAKIVLCGENLQMPRLKSGVVIFVTNRNVMLVITNIDSEIICEMTILKSTLTITEIASHFFLMLQSMDFHIDPPF